MDRRYFLKSAAATATAAIPFGAFVSRVEAHGRRPRHDAAYGPLAPVREETTGLPLLMLPAGFSYLTFGWTGDLMSNGTPTRAPITPPAVPLLALADGCRLAMRQPWSDPSESAGTCAGIGPV